MLNFPKNDDAGVSQENGFGGLIDVILVIFIIQFLFSALGGGDGGGILDGLFGGLTSSSSNDVVDLDDE
ncbi:hypothetical protein [Selenihalanaerobacter shriftii]|uniref:Uncharacterized protein n=1 Tax=Selenihalanaerobacter shriftii TaxID=142842 RepID=A0A1T4QSG3_9FIRM|nr:hypothetical protein [Selenihalanaerobacter shriftii]SKA06723.1 hypothetical protein SAMN02745118_02678 [Selenihalanaerobacter shriftii]